MAPKGFKELVSVVRAVEPNLSFSILEVGARVVDGVTEEFHQLLDFFPDSKIIALEVNEEVCAISNAKSREGVSYYPFALGKKNERRQFFETEHPMCSSLYKPNEALLSLYNGLEVMALKKITEIDTVSLDDFVVGQQLGAIDFIKIDVQGAEYEIFEGGPETLENVLQVVTEVEFLPLYENQPLFGDICQLLHANNLMFNKFHTWAGRTLRPVILNNDPHSPSQHLWSDAVFIRNLEKIDDLKEDQLLKLSILALFYGGMDLAFFCLSCFDQRRETNISTNWFAML